MFSVAVKLQCRSRGALYFVSKTPFLRSSEKLFYSIIFRGKIHEPDMASVKGSIGATLPAINLAAAVF